MITASVTDSGGLSGSAQVTVVVTASATITLTAQGFKEKGVRKANLSWSGASGAVDIYRNNVFVITDAASPFEDTIPGKGGGSFTYKVCAGSVCSNNATVTF